MDILYACKSRLTILLVAAMSAGLLGCSTMTATTGVTDQQHAEIAGESDVKMLKAAWDGRLMEVLALLEEGVDPNIKGPNGITALSLATQNNHKRIIKKLLEKGADPNIGDDKAGWFPLMWAAYNGFNDTMLLLLENGADVNLKNQFNETALLHAAFEGRDEAVRILLDHGADYTATNDKGYSALKAASNKGYFRIVDMLTEAGAKLENDA